MRIIASHFPLARDHAVPTHWKVHQAGQIGRPMLAEVPLAGLFFVACGGWIDIR